MTRPLSHTERKAGGLPDSSLAVPRRTRPPHSDYAPGGAMDPAEPRRGIAHLLEHQESLASRGLRLLSREEAADLYPAEQVERYFRAADPAEATEDAFADALADAISRRIGGGR